MGVRPNTIADFWRFVDKTTDPAGCWLWTRCLTSKGYGKIRIAGQQHRTHRLAYELTIGSIPPGLVLDHPCRVRHCCNPSHLEPVTNQENVLRGVGLAAQNARATHCSRGHEFTEANTALVGAERRCRKCDRLRARAYRARQKQFAS